MLREDYHKNEFCFEPSLTLCIVMLCTVCLLPRYGLYSSPFDPVLFDLEVSGSSCKNAFNSSIGVQSDEIDLSEILSGLHHIPPYCLHLSNSFINGFILVWAVLWCV